MLQTRALSRPPTTSVPAFALYGEAEGGADLEFLHIEPVSARSERHGWEIAAHTHRGLFQTLFLFDQAGEATLDSRRVEAPPLSVVVVPPGVVHAFAFQPGTQGYVLTLAASWAAPLADARARALLEGLHEEASVIDLGEDAAQARALLDQLFAETREMRPAHAIMSEWLAAAVLLIVARRRVAAVAPTPRNDPRAELFTRFRACIEDRFTEHWPVSRYAEALKVTESRLDRACRAFAGRSAFEVIQNRLLIEARRRLVHIAAPVSALAYELGFEDPAYFCRFFKRHVGETPTRWRRSQRDRMAGAGQGRDGHA